MLLLSSPTLGCGGIDPWRADVRNKFAVCVVADEGCRPLPADKKGVPVGPTFYLPWRRRYYAIDGGLVSWRPPPRRLLCFSMFIYSPCLTLLKSCFLSTDIHGRWLTDRRANFSYFERRKIELTISNLGWKLSNDRVNFSLEKLKCNYIIVYQEMEE